MLVGIWYAWRRNDVALRVMHALRPNLVVSHLRGSPLDDCASPSNPEEEIDAEIE